jgi:hypothetical protein
VADKIDREYEQNDGSLVKLFAFLFFFSSSFSLSLGIVFAVLECGCKSASELGE